MSLSKKIIAAVFGVSVTIGLIIGVRYAMQSDNQNAEKNIKANTNIKKEIEKISSSKMKDGEYYGESNGYGGH